MYHMNKGRSETLNPGRQDMKAAARLRRLWADKPNIQTCTASAHEAYKRPILSIPAQMLKRRKVKSRGSVNYICPDMWIMRRVRSEPEDTNYQEKKHKLHPRRLFLFSLVRIRTHLTKQTLQLIRHTIGRFVLCDNSVCEPRLRKQYLKTGLERWASNLQMLPSEPFSDIVLSDEPTEM